MTMMTTNTGLWFYGYNELATMTIKKTSAVTQSVANTAKRVIGVLVLACVSVLVLVFVYMVHTSLCMR
jgi:solute carrier family 35 protein E1